MEEKRSIHSLRSAGRVHHPRDYTTYSASAASAANDDEKGASAGAGSNGRTRKMLHHGDGSSHGGGGGGSGQYLKVEGQAYRVVQRTTTTSSTRSTGAGGSSQLAPPETSLRIRRCSDAQTQSNESSFAALDNTDPGGLNHLRHTHPPAPHILTTSTATNSYSSCDATNNAELGGPCVQVGVPSRGPSPVLLAPSPQPAAAAFFPAPPSPTIQLAYGYDPTYCQPLGQAADGYQYELVRRPSIGPPLAAATELTVPAAAAAAGYNPHLLRRPSAHSPTPLFPAHHHHQHHQPITTQHSLAQTNSLQGSFDSCAGPPPITPLFIQNPTQQIQYPIPQYYHPGHHLSQQQQQQPQQQQQQPLSPRHLQGSGSSPAFRAPAASSASARSSSIPPPIPPTTTASSNSDMPKLIQETSI